MKRYVSTTFWDDEWVQSLNFTEKGLYMYFLTNPLTNIAGVYKISNRRIAFDTGLSEQQIEEIMERFSAAHKAFRKGEYLIFPAWPVHQNYQNAKIYRGIRKILEKFPADLLSFLKEVGYRYPLDEFLPGLPETTSTISADAPFTETYPESKQTDEMKLFLHLWRTTKDKNGSCIFLITATIEHPRDWERFWQESKPTAEQIETAFRNFAEGIDSGAIPRQFIPATPDRFVLKNGISRYQTPVVKENADAGKVAGVDMLADKIAL